MKKLLSALCLLSLASTLAFAQEFYRPPQKEYRSNEYRKDENRLRERERPFPRHVQFGPPPPRPYTCPTEFKPVCARTRGNIVATYSNSCFAEQDGSHVIDPTDACPPISCPATYEPVCARKTFSRQGENRPADGNRPFRRPRPGPQNVDAPYELVPYYNDCAAKQDGAVPLTAFTERKFRHVDHRYLYADIIDFNSVCPKTCPGIIELVCGEDENGKLRLYANRCSAILEGALFIKRGVCSGR